jgi:hypothetical protein
LETVQRDYAPRGVAFYYLYKALAHPEYDDYVTPFTLEERLMHVKEAERRLGSEIAWLADSMDDDLKHALGNAPNAGLVIDPEGKVAARRGWSDPDALRADLVELIGPVDEPTRVEDLDMPSQSPPKRAATGVVPRVEPSSPMRALTVEPRTADSEVPFYVKLRAEADRGVFERGKGTIYLGFHLDPLYRVHWNNETRPLSFVTDTPKGMWFRPGRDSAPKVKEPADADPREFLVEVEGAGRGEAFDLRVRYFACDDADTFCVPVTQTYRVEFTVDRDGGTVFSRARRRGAPPDGMPRERTPGDMANRIMGMDANGDGKVSPEEMPEGMRRRFDMIDSDDDGFIDEEEAEAAIEQIRRGMNEARRESNEP